MADVTCSDGKTIILPNENDEKNVSNTIIPFEMAENQKFGLKIQSATKQITIQHQKHQQKPKQYEMKLTSDNKSNVNSCSGISLDGVGGICNNKNSNSNLNINENHILMPPAINCIDKNNVMSGISGLKKILPKNFFNKNNNMNSNKIGLQIMPQNATVTPTAATVAAVSAKKVDNKTKAGPQTPCQDADDDSRAKKRCSDRYDSSESSDSGVATLSCTDSSTASSDASDPGSPYSPGSIGEDTHQLLKTNMTPQLLQAAQIQQHQSNSIKTQWPWNTSKTVNNNNNVKAINNNNTSTGNNKLKRLSSHSVNDAVTTAKKLRTSGNSGDKLSASLIGSSHNIGNHAKRLKTTPEDQQTKITGYFKSQMKPLNGLKKEISNLVARSSIEAQSTASGLDKYFNILAKAKDDKDQSSSNAHGIKKDFELDVRTLTTMSTPSLKKIERKTTTKVAQVAPMSRKTNTTLPTSNLNGKSPKKHVAIAPRTSEIKKTQANMIRKGTTNGNIQQIDNLKSTQPTVLLTAIRIPASIHQTSGVSTLSSNGPTKIAPKPQPSQTLNNAVTTSTALNTSPNKVNPLFQIPVMPNLVQIPNLITTSRANLVMNNGQLTRMGNSTQYFVNGTVIKVQQIGTTPNGVTNGNTTSSMLSMESGLTSNILVKQATIAQTVPFSTVTTTTKPALPIQQQQPLSISSQSLSSQTTPTIQSSLSSGSQTSVTTTSLGNQQTYVSNGSNSRIQPQSVFMATSAGLLLNATLPAVITTSKLPGLNQPLPALHPIQPSTQSTNILPSINTILQSSHHHQHHHHHPQLTTSVAPQIIVSQSHQSLVNISQSTLSSIASINGLTRSQQNLPLASSSSPPPEIITPKLSEPPSLRLISNTVSDILTSTTTTTTFTSTLTSWSKQIAETIQNDSEKTIRRESFKPSISLREPVLPPLLPITLPSLPVSPPALPPVSVAPVVAVTTNKCENKITKDLDSIKLVTQPPIESAKPLIWVKTTSDLLASPKLSTPPDDKENKEDTTESSLPIEPKSLILDDKQEKLSPDVFIDEEKLISAEEIKPTILKEITANEDKLNNIEEHNDVKHNDSIEIETPKTNGIDLSAVEVDIDLVNKTTSAINGCAKSPILSQPKTIRFPALKSDSNFRFGPKGTKRHDGVCYWDNCNQKYDNCSKLLDHLQTQHVNTQTGPYSCLWSGCKVHGRESCSRRWLERHALSHGGTKPFKCIVDGCGLRFGSQLALQKHVNGHFNTTENKDNPNKRTSDPPVPKLLRKNGKKLRYRRQPFSARLFDFFDSGVMEGLQHRLMVTGLLANGPKGSVTFQGRTMARRVTFEGKPEIFVRWSPCDIIPDEWIPETQGKITKDVIIHSMGSQELIALQKYLGIAYLKPDLNTLHKEEPTSIAVALNNSLARTNNRKHLRKPPKQTAQPS